MTDKEREHRYREIVDGMQPGVQYTASELGVAPASMTAMVNRGLVEKIVGKPMKYMRPISSSSSEIDSRILKALEGYPEDSYFSLQKDNYISGRVCTIQNGQVCDVNDYMKNIKTDEFDTLYIKGKKVDLKSI